MTERAPLKEEKVRKPAEASIRFLEVIKEWKRLEDETIRFSMHLTRC